MKRFVLAVSVTIQALVLSPAFCQQSIPDPVAMVNGAPISSSVFIDQSVLQAGKQVMQGLIEQQIVLQWAAQEGVAPTDDQINKQIEAFKREGMYEDQVASLGEANVKAELRTMQARINLVKKLDKISDKEIEDAYNMMKSRWVRGPRKQLAVIVNSDKARVEEAAQKIKEGMDFDKAAIEYSDPRFTRGAAIKLWVEENQEGMPPDILKAAQETKVGETSGVINIAVPNQPSQFAIVKVLQEQPKIDLKLSEVRDEVENYLAMQKAQASPDFQKQFDEQKKKAQIDIKLPKFADVAGIFKNPPPPAPPMPEMMPEPAPQPAPKAVKPVKKPVAPVKKAPVKKPAVKK